MITGWQLYLLTRLGDLKDLLVTPLLMIPILTAIITTIVAIHHRVWDEGYKLPIKYPVLSWIFLFGWLGIWVVIPSTKEMAAILILPKVLNNEKVQELPNNLLTLANEWIEELKPKKESK